MVYSTFIHQDHQYGPPSESMSYYCSTVECQSVWFSWTSLYSGVERAEVQYVRKGQRETTVYRKQAQSHGEGVQGKTVDSVRGRKRGIFGNVCSGQAGVSPWIRDSETAEP